MKKNPVIIGAVLILIGMIQLAVYTEPLPASDYITLPSGNLAYSEYGNGAEVLIMIHGSPGSKESLKNLAKNISNKKIYVPDMFCFGESTKELNNCGIEFAAKTISDFMDSKEIETATILGYSWGGSVVITFAYNYPEKLDNLILVSGNGIQEGEPTKSFLLERIRSYVAYPFAVYYPGSFAGDYRWRRGFIKSFIDSDQRIIEEELKEISTRTLVLHGKEDTVILPWVAEKQNGLLQNSSLEFFEGNHQTIFNDVEEISQKINSFLENG